MTQPQLQLNLNAFNFKNLLDLTIQQDNSKNKRETANYNNVRYSIFSDLNSKFDFNQNKDSQHFYLNKSRKVFLVNLTFISAQPDKIFFRPYKILDRNVLYSYKKSRLKFRKFARSRFNIKEFINPYLLNDRTRFLLQKCEKKVLSNLSSFYSFKRKYRRILKYSKPRARLTRMQTRNYNVSRKNIIMHNIKKKFNDSKKLKSKNKKRIFHLLRALSSKNYVKFIKMRRQGKIKSKRSSVKIKITKFKLNLTSNTNKFKQKRISLSNSILFSKLMFFRKNRRNMLEFAQKVTGNVLHKIRLANRKFFEKKAELKKQKIPNSKFKIKRSAKKSRYVFLPLDKKKVSNNSVQKSLNKYIRKVKKRVYKRSRIYKLKVHFMEIARDKLLNKYKKKNRNKAQRTVKKTRLSAKRKRKIYTYVPVTTKEKKISRVNSTPWKIRLAKRKKRKLRRNIAKWKKRNTFRKFVRNDNDARGKKRYKKWHKEKAFHKPRRLRYRVKRNQFTKRAFSTLCFRKGRYFVRPQFYAIKTTAPLLKVASPYIGYQIDDSISSSFDTAPEKVSIVNKSSSFENPNRIISKYERGYRVAFTSPLLRSLFRLHYFSFLKTNINLNDAQQKRNVVIMSEYLRQRRADHKRALNLFHEYAQQLRLKKNQVVSNNLIQIDSNSKIVKQDEIPVDKEKERENSGSTLSKIISVSIKPTTFKRAFYRMHYKRKKNKIIQKIRIKRSLRRLKLGKRKILKVHFPKIQNKKIKRLLDNTKRKRTKSINKWAIKRISLQKLYKRGRGVRGRLKYVKKRRKRYKPHIFKGNRLKFIGYSKFRELLRLKTLLSTLYKYRSRLLFLKKQKILISKLRKIKSYGLLKLLKFLNIRFGLNIRKMKRRYKFVKRLYLFRKRFFLRKARLRWRTLFYKKYLRRNDAKYTRLRKYRYLVKKIKAKNLNKTTESTFRRLFVISKHIPKKIVFKRRSFKKSTYLYKNIVNYSNLNRQLSSRKKSEIKKKIYFDNKIRSTRYSSLLPQSSQFLIMSKKLYVLRPKRPYKSRRGRNWARWHKKRRTLQKRYVLKNKKFTKFKFKFRTHGLFKRYKLQKPFYLVRRKKIIRSKYYNRYNRYKYKRRFIRISTDKKRKTLNVSLRYNHFKRGFQHRLARGVIKRYQCKFWKTTLFSADKPKIKRRIFKKLESKFIRTSNKFKVHKKNFKSNLKLLRRTFFSPSTIRSKRKYKVRKELVANSTVLRTFFLPLLSFEKQPERLGQIKVLSRVRFSKRILVLLKKIDTVLKYVWKIRTKKKKMQKTLPYMFRRKKDKYRHRYYSFNNKKQQYRHIKRYFRKRLQLLSWGLYERRFNRRKYNRDRYLNRFNKNFDKDFVKKMNVVEKGREHLKEFKRKLSHYKFNQKSVKLFRKRLSHLGRIFVRSSVLRKRFLESLSNANVVKNKKKEIEEAEILLNTKYTMPQNYLNIKRKSRVFYYYNFMNVYYDMLDIDKQASVPLDLSYIVCKQEVEQSPRFQKLDGKKKEFSFYNNIKPPFKKGRIIVRFKKNNVFMCLLNKQKKVITKLSGGSIQFKGKARATPYAKERVAKTLARRAFSKNYKVIDIVSKNYSRRHNYKLMKGFSRSRLFIRTIDIQQPNPHGYIRLKKPRRI